MKKYLMFIVAIIIASTVHSLSLPSYPSWVNSTMVNNTVNLSWASVSGATSYTICEDTILDGSFSDCTTGITTTSYIDYDAKDKRRIFYNISAVNASGSNSSPSIIVKQNYTLRRINGSTSHNFISLYFNSSYITKAIHLLNNITNAIIITRWNKTNQKLEQCRPGLCPTICGGNLCNFGISKEESYRVEIGFTSPLSVEWTATGIVYEPVDINLYEGINWVSLYGGNKLNLSSELRESIGYNCSNVNKYNSTTQEWIEDEDYSDDPFRINLEYGYQIVVSSDTTWNNNPPPSPSWVNSTMVNNTVNLSWANVQDASSYIVCEDTDFDGKYSTCTDGLFNTWYTDHDAKDKRRIFYKIYSNTSNGRTSKEIIVKQNYTLRRINGGEAINYISLYFNSSYISKAQDLLNNITESTIVMRWNTTNQKIESCLTGFCPNPPFCGGGQCNFGISKGESYRVEIDSSSPLSIEWTAIGVVYKPIDVTLKEGRNWVSMYAGTEISDDLNFLESIGPNTTNVSKWDNTNQVWMMSNFTYNPRIYQLSNFTVTVEDGYEIWVSSDTAWNNKDTRAIPHNVTINVGNDGDVAVSYTHLTLPTN